MKLKFLLLFLLLSGFCMAQHPKKHLVSFKEWHLPGTVIPSCLKTYTIRYADVPFKEIPFVVAHEKFKSQNHSIAFDKKKLFDGSVYKGMALRQFKFVSYVNEADFQIRVALKNLRFKVCAKEKKDIGSDKAIYKGELLGLCNLSMAVVDKQGNNLFETEKQVEKLIEEVTSSNNQAIMQRDVAFDLILQKYRKKSDEFQRKLVVLLNENIKKLGREVVKNIDFYIQSTELPIYTMKRKKGYDFVRVNEKTNQFMEVLSQSYTSQYDSTAFGEAKAVIQFWEQEMQKYDPQNKRDKKVLWSLLSNITSAYYVVGDYERAIQTTGKLDELNHRWNNEIIKELAEKRVELIALHNAPDGRSKSDYTSVNYKKVNQAICREKGREIYFKNKGYKKGTLVTNDGKEKEGYISINNHDKVAGIVDQSLLNGRSASLIMIDSEGKKVKRTYKASDCQYIVFPGDDTQLVILYRPVKCMLSRRGQKEYNAEKLTLEGRKSRFLKVICDSKKIKVYLYYSEIFLQKPNWDYCKSTSSVKFHLAFRKELAKLAPDCPQVLEKIEKREYENTLFGITDFVNDYLECFND